MKRIILVLLFVQISVNNLFAQDPKQNEVMMKMLALKTSLINKDSTSLVHLLDDEVTYGHTNGLIQSKAELVKDIMTGVQDYKNIEPADTKIRIYDNSAVVTMKALVKLNYNKQPLDLSMFITLVWINKNGDWKLVARQSVKNN